MSNSEVLWLARTDSRRIAGRKSGSGKLNRVRARVPQSSRFGKHRTRTAGAEKSIRCVDCRSRFLEEAVVCPSHVGTPKIRATVVSFRVVRATNCESPHCLITAMSMVHGLRPGFTEENRLTAGAELCAPQGLSGTEDFVDRFGDIAHYRIGPRTHPARTTVLMCQYVTHRERRFFPEPLRFMPERWSDEAKAKLTRLAYFPFGARGRQCIGESFAWMEAVLVMATLAQKWKLRLVPEDRVEPQPLITLHSKHGMRMEVEPHAALVRPSVRCGRAI